MRQFRADSKGVESLSTSVGVRSFAGQLRVAPFELAQRIVDGTVSDEEQLLGQADLLPEVPLARTRGLVQLFGKGALCDVLGSKRPRRASVSYICDEVLADDEHTFRISEPQTCAYELIIYTPLVCGLH